MVAVAILLIAGLTPLVGKYCDLFNSESVYRFGTLGVIALSPLLFYALSLHQLYFIMTVMLIYAGLIACISSAIFSILVGLFPFGVRYSGVSLAFNLGVTVFSSSTPLALMSVEKYYASIVAPGIYMSLCAVLALMISHCLKKKISVLRFNEIDQEKMIYQYEG
jgi:MHS family proline/betaine transporter-like MFS transporter